MLILRDEQLAALGAHLITAFKDRMAGSIRTNYPQQYEGLSEEGIRRFIDRAIAAAASWNVHTEGGVAVLIELMLEFGERFESSPDPAWAIGFLEHPELPGPVKVGVIRDRFPPPAEPHQHLPGQVDTPS